MLTNIPPIDSDQEIPGSGQDAGQTDKDHSIQLQISLKSQKYEPIIKKYAGYYQLDPSLIHSIIATESGFNPNAVSSKGAQGLMQLMPDTAERLGVKNSFDPEQNIHAGVRHFRSLMDMFNNNLDLSLAAYNAGENLVLRLGRVPEYKETLDYVRSVTRRYKERREMIQKAGLADNSITFRYVDKAGTLHITNIPPGQ